MWYDNLFEELEKKGDEVQSKKMASYMKNKFSFLGIPKSILKEYLKPFLKESKKFDLDWNFISMCWEKPYREAQYVAIEYII